MQNKTYVSNPRTFALTSDALRSVGFWGIRSGYDTPLSISHEEFALQNATDFKLTVEGEGSILSRCFGDTEATKEGRRIWWKASEDFTALAGKTFAFLLEATIDGRRIRIAEGEIEVEE